MRRPHIFLVPLALSVSLFAADVPVRRTTPRAQVETVSPLIMQARRALFEDSQLDRARQLAQEELRRNPGDMEALFIEMEAAALEADSAAELNAAVKIVESRPSKQEDARIAIAAARVLELAANTEDFRAAIPRLQARLALASHRDERNVFLASLRMALVAASTDGAPAINTEKEVREAGLMTEWRVAGPFGNYPNLEFDQHWSPEHDLLLQSTSEARAVEHLHFDDGQFRLPSYFPKSGVLYAASELLLKNVDNFLVRVESLGTLEVLVDGTVALRKDDRFRITPETAWSELKLKAGVHHVVVKFLATAAPFRVAIVPAAAVPPRNRAMEYLPEATYVAEAQKYWTGDYSGVISDLGFGGAPRTAIVSFLLYRAWTHVADDSPEAPTLLNTALQLAPEAIAAEYELASRAFQAERTDEALSRLQRVIAARDNFLPGQELLAQIAIQLNWPALSEKALEFQLRVHPSCDVLLRGYKFFAGHARYEKSHDLLRRMADCAPDAMAYVRALEELGEHAKAASSAEVKVHRRPLDRSAREVLVRELAMAGQMDRARAAAEDLAALAPNSDRYRRMANVARLDPAALLNDTSVRGNFGGEPFYATYRRDGVQMVRKTDDRKFSGGPALMLVNDRVARLSSDGRVSLYVHKLTRMLDRDGIEKYGEVSVPRAAEILELRTIKPDGSFAEPEVTPQKASVSMPALAVGDTIEEEYVVHYGDAGGIESHADVFRHVFGSFAAPILYSRFVAITPSFDTVLHTDVAPGILPARIEADAQRWTQVWEKNDIPQSVEETAIARGDVLPSVRLLPATDWSDIRDGVRNQLADAMRIGPRVAQMAVQLRAKDGEAKAREISRTIVKSIRPSGTFNPAELGSAEDILASHSGNRTIALLAVARAAGLDVDLVLSRRAGDVVRVPRASRDFYSRPLVRFRFADGQQILVDAETDGLAFGSIAPAVERRDALLISMPHAYAAAREPEPAPIISLSSDSDEQSVAEANITIDDRGDLKADVVIRMGSWRAAQMRSILAVIEPGRRPNYYQQLATRIFSGAEGVTGTTRNENDPDQKLELALHCRVPAFLNLAQGAVDIDQLVPALGLKKMYPGVARRYPLYIDTPLVERANFRLHLPPGVRLSRSTPGVKLTGAFGSYSFALRQVSPGLLEIQRVFSIPAQVVQPDQYADFSGFASRIDEAERVRISLQKN